MYDAIVIGKGPAGLSASLYLGREGYKILVLGKDGNLMKCNELDNFLGISMISGPEFIETAERQVINVGAEIKSEKVLKVIKKEKVFIVTTDNREYKCKSIVMALGVKKTDIRIKNIDKYIGKGVSYCVSCDGFFYKNKNVGIIGNSEYAIEQALNLKNYTENITIFTNGKDMENVNEKYIDNLKSFNVDNRKIKSLLGNTELTHIQFEEEDKIGIDGVFIANETPNIDDLANNIGITIDNNKVVVDENNMTNVEGIFACGDMINKYKQVSTAVGSGAIAAYSCIKFILNLKLDKE